MVSAKRRGRSRDIDRDVGGTRYVVDIEDGYEDLYRRLTNQPRLLYAHLRVELNVRRQPAGADNMSTEREPNTFVERDRDYADWNRVRSAIEHENMLVNHRLTWFGSLQAFLFTAFGVVLTVYVSETKGAYLFLVFVIGFLGMSISFFIRVTLKQAQTQLTSLDCWWHSDDRSKLADKNQWRELIKNGYLSEELRVKKLPKHPPLQIYTSKWPKWITDYVHDYNIPDLFIVAWIFILIAVWLWIA